MKSSSVKSASRLLRPIPDQCSLYFSEGWAFADGVIERGDDIASSVPQHWTEDKLAGFNARIKLEGESRVA